MPHRRGTRSTILATTLAWLALTAAQSAAAQLLVDGHPDHAPCRTEPQPGDGSWCYPKGKEIRVVVRQPYAAAIGSIGFDERDFRKATAEGRQPPYERQRFGEQMGISDAEDDAIRAIMLEASNRVRSLDKEIFEDGDELDRHYSDELADKRFALIAQLQPIYDAVPGKLREQIGEGEANKVEAYFKYRWGSLKTKTFIYFYRRGNMSVYLGDLPNIGQRPEARKDD